MPAVAANSDPVEKLASSDATNSTSHAISSGSLRDHNLRSLGGESAREAGAHSTCTTRDDHRPIVETFHDSLVQFSCQDCAHDSQRKAGDCSPQRVEYKSGSAKMVPTKSPRLSSTGPRWL